jgi:hypothetical protein
VAFFETARRWLFLLTDLYFSLCRTIQYIGFLYFIKLFGWLLADSLTLLHQLRWCIFEQLESNASKCILNVNGSFSILYSNPILLLRNISWTRNLETSLAIESYLKTLVGLPRTKIPIHIFFGAWNYTGAAHQKLWRQASDSPLGGLGCSGSITDLGDPPAPERRDLSGWLPSGAWWAFRRRVQPKPFVDPSLPVSLCCNIINDVRDGL